MEMVPSLLLVLFHCHATLSSVYGDWLGENEDRGGSDNVGYVKETRGFLCLIIVWNILMIQWRQILGRYRRVRSQTWRTKAAISTWLGTDVLAG